MDNKIFKLSIVVSDHYVFRCLAKNPVIYNNGNTLTYTEIGTYNLKGILVKHNKPKQATISNCPFKLLEYEEQE